MCGSVHLGSLRSVYHVRAMVHDQCRWARDDALEMAIVANAFVWLISESPEYLQVASHTTCLCAWSHSCIHSDPTPFEPTPAKGRWPSNSPNLCPHHDAWQPCRFYGTFRVCCCERNEKTSAVYLSSSSALEYGDCPCHAMHLGTEPTRRDKERMYRQPHQGSTMDHEMLCVRSRLANGYFETIHIGRTGVGVSRSPHDMRVEHLSYQLQSPYSTQGPATSVFYGDAMLYQATGPVSQRGRETPRRDPCMVSTCYLVSC